MPYNLDDFPIRTNRPRIDVTLPVGRHEFELVVVDSAGLRSAPDRIVVYVEKQDVRPPEITGIDKTFGLRGETVETSVHGQNLRDATDIRFDLIEGRAARAERTSGTRIDARILAGGTETELRVALRVAGNAPLGEYGFSVTTRGGTANSPVNFLVTAVPQIDNFGPAWTDVGETEEMTIEGSYLLIPSLEPDFDDPQKPLRYHSVEIVSTEGTGPAPVPGINAEIVKTRSRPDSLTVNIAIGDDVKPGAYHVRLNTPAGSVEAEEDFQVRAES